MATYEEYLRKALEAAEGGVNKQNDLRKTATEQAIADANGAIDTAAGNTNAGYQRQIDEAPKQYMADYDRNAIAQMVGQRNLKEAMANAGLTDSGLNASQLTALQVQKNNADAAVAAQQNSYVRQLQDAMSKVLADAETQKASFATERRAADADWYSAAMANARNSAMESAADSYNAEQEAKAKEVAARITAQNDYNKALLSAQTEAARLAASDAKNEAAARNDAIKLMMADGMSYAEAVDEYDNGGKTNKAYSKYVSQGYSDVNARAMAEAEARGGNAKDALAVSAYELALNAVGDYNDPTKLSKQSFYTSLDRESKKYAEAIVAGNYYLSAGNGIGKWGDGMTSKEAREKAIYDKFSGNYLQAALEAAGLR